MTGLFPRAHTKGTLKGRNTMKNKKLGTIKIVSEKEVPYVEMKVDMDDDVAHKLAQAGWMEIQHDREALINYAFVRALQEFCGSNRGR